MQLYTNDICILKSFSMHLYTERIFFEFVL